MTTKVKDKADTFLDTYNKDVQVLADKYRRLIKKKIPGIDEQVDTSAVSSALGSDQNMLTSFVQ